MTPVEALDFADLDILDPAIYQDPHPVYTWLRRHAPLHWDDTNQLWVASCYDDVVYVSTHPELFCSGRGVRPRVSVDLSLIGLDDPMHQQQRRLINRGFTPRMVRRLEPRVREIVGETIDRIANRGTCDFVADLAVPVPLIVIAELMGLPVEDRERFWHWSDAMMAGEGHSGPDDPVARRSGAAFSEYVAYVSAIVDERRRAYRAAQRARERGEQPPDLDEDLISVLVAADEEGMLPTRRELTEDELLMFLVLVVVAGNETTRNAMSGGMLAFSRFADEWRRFVDHPELSALAADEIVRYVSPVLSFVRTATRDTQLRGTEIREGERVLMLYQSANRDEDVFDAPDELRIDREPNNHVGFGIGPHFCLGANLARLEIRVLFEELARRLPDIHVPPGTRVRFGDSTLVHAIERLPVVFTPE